MILGSFQLCSFMMLTSVLAGPPKPESRNLYRRTTLKAQTVPGSVAPVTVSAATQGAATSGMSGTPIGMTNFTTTACGQHPSSGRRPPSGAVIVDPTGQTPGSYKTIVAGFAALPNDASCQTLFLRAGTYREQVNFDRPGPTIVIGQQFAGDPGETYSHNEVTIVQAKGYDVNHNTGKFRNEDTAPMKTTRDTRDLKVYNVNFVNDYNKDGTRKDQVASAAAVNGDRNSFYACAFVAWQDTLYTQSKVGYHYFSNCYIEGATDFVWGFSGAVFQGSVIAAKKHRASITAHARDDAHGIGGYMFDKCLITLASKYKHVTEVYLGRPYSPYARVVYKNSYMDRAISPLGWNTWKEADQRSTNIFFAEYNNIGPGNWENNVAGRKQYAHAVLLKQDDISIKTILGTVDWIDQTYMHNVTIPAEIKLPAFLQSL